MGETINGILVTGKYKERKGLALTSIENFFEQTYPDKHLIIVNTDDERYTEDDDQVTEILADPSKFLGELRNIGLEQLNDGDVWVQWDDDDFRHPEILEKQYESLKNNDCHTNCLAKQLVYSFKNHSIKAYAKNGDVGKIEGTIMSHKCEIRYQNVKRGEDTKFIQAIEHCDDKKVCSFNNDPELYIRNVHYHNTWPDGHFALPAWANNGLKGYDKIINDMINKYKKNGYLKNG